MFTRDRWHRLVLHLMRAVKPTLFGSLGLFALTYGLIERLPAPETLHPLLLQAPVQTPTQLAPFVQDVRGQSYLVHPHFEYTLAGLVVTQNDLAKSWLERVGFRHDPFNEKDICVVWGGTAASGAYRDASFSSGSFTCYVQFPSDAAFSMEELSNNHLLPATPAIAATLHDIRVGDQIHLHGQLVDYGVGLAGVRTSSTTRIDQGNGACEVIYVDQLTILHPANAVWRLLHSSAGWGIVASLLLWLYATFFHNFVVGERQAR
ncbi:MAG: hypothetical protein HY696_05220 [Deltaproteobacteria bacterium]|nr:hypothetical protein [Deltaproteobacteria bacterium]